tara:strand:+ start:1781 stop:2758 length:978 start_codon:yes stop_codon:yes gene_type:complete
MKLLFENWRKYLEEDTIDELSLPFSSQARMEKELKKLENEMVDEKHASAWEKIKQEMKETKTAWVLAKKYFTKGLTKEEKSFLWDQIKDIARGTTLAALFAAPGGSVALPFVLKFTKGTLLPSAFKENLRTNKTAGTIVAIFGPSGCGKSRQKAVFKNNGWQELVSLVTRPPRGEKDVEYEFTTEEEWLKEYEQGNLINTNQYGGNYYGTKLDDFLAARNAVMITDETNVDGSRGEEDLRNIAEKYGKTLVLAFCAPPDEKKLEKRHQNRLKSGEYSSEEEYKKRLKKAKEEASSTKYRIKTLNIGVHELHDDEDTEELARSLRK